MGPTYKELTEDSTETTETKTQEDRSERPDTEGRVILQGHQTDGPILVTLCQKKSVRRIGVKYDEVDIPIGFSFPWVPRH